MKERGLDSHLHAFQYEKCLDVGGFSEEGVGGVQKHPFFIKEHPISPNYLHSLIENYVGNIFYLHENIENSIKQCRFCPIFIENDVGKTDSLSDLHSFMENYVGGRLF